MRLTDVPEDLLSQEVPSDEDRIFPELPTATNFTDSVVVVVVVSVVPVAEYSSLSSLQEMTVRLKMDMKIMYKTLFIFFIHQ